MSLQDESKTNFIVRLGSHSVTEHDLLTELKYRTSWHFVQYALERKLVNELFEEHSIDLDEEKIYEFMDAFRESNDLYSEEEIDNWLQLNNLSDDEFFDFCRHYASLEVLKSKLFPEEKISETFVYRRPELDAVELYHILVPDLDLAQELLAQSNEGESFFALAHKFSRDEETRKTCGYLGLVRRKELRAEVEGAVFSAKTGAVVGPFKGTNGYHLYLVDKLVLAELDDNTKAQLRGEFFRNLLDSKIRIQDIEYQEIRS